jgi:hypothetical protein
MIRLADLVEAIDGERADRLPYAGGLGNEADR